MTSIPVAKCRFSKNKCKRLYLKKVSPFFDFLYHFLNVNEIENILKKREEYPSLIISEVIASERDVCLSV